MKLEPLRAALVAGLFLSLAASPLARAAEAAPPLPEDPRAPRFQEVERGFFTSFEAGYLTFFKTPTADRTRFRYAPADGGTSSGLLIGATVGYDLTDRLALAAFVLGSENSAGTSYGSFSTLVAGGDVRYAFLGSRDRYGVERLRLYVHGRAGFLVTRPVGLFGDSDTYFAGGPGVEYFTHLRHFSVGLAADLAYAAKAGAAGLAVTPTVRYTF